MNIYFLTFHQARAEVTIYSSLSIHVHVVIDSNIPKLVNLIRVYRFFDYVNFC